MTPARQLAWGRAHSFAQQIVQPRSAAEALTALREASGTVLPFGRGRSYGDSCLNEGGVLIDTRYLDRYIAFDPATGLLQAQAGVTVADVLAHVCRPDHDGSAWFPAVMPGTRWVTLGGAVANDIHGKNHHRHGTFGCHAKALTILRPNGEQVRCSRHENPELHAATIGGLGLTGLILDVTLQLRRVPGLMLIAEDTRFDNLDEFYAIAAESEAGWEYTVAWIDCLASGKSLGRGVFSRANHIPGPIGPVASMEPSISVPASPPVSPFSRASLLAFNGLYWRRIGRRGPRRRVVDYAGNLFPLDAIGHWNRLYGRRGFFQYQCVLPAAVARDGIAELLATIGRSGQGSFLAVLKTLGTRQSGGLLSFPLAGTTLALDFPNRGRSTLELLERLDAITLAAGGRLYPAKDGRMGARMFAAGYAELARFKLCVAPGFSSSFWRRIATGTPGERVPVQRALAMEAR